MSISKLCVSEKYKHIGAAFSGKLHVAGEAEPLVESCYFFYIKNT